jgi:hypothetical protein
VFLSNRRKLAWLLASGLGAAPVLATEQATQPSVSDQIQALRARIDQLETQQKAQEQQNQQATVENALSDADRRTKYINATGVSAGWNQSKQQFFIGSEDGNFYLHPFLIAQFRHVANYREHATTSAHGKSDFEEGFEVRRAKFGFDGNLFTPDLTYRFVWEDNSTGSPGLEYAWAQYVFAHHVFETGELGVRAGQFKDIVFKEEFTSDAAQLLSERSLANALVGGIAPPGKLIQGVDFLLLGNDAPQSLRIQRPAEGASVDCREVGCLHQHYEGRAA